jgi:ABC-type cobalt transport system substrate-binding protein
MSCLALGLPATTLQQSFPSSHPDISAERLLFSLAVENDSQAKFLTTKQFHALKQMSDPLFRDVKYSVESLLFSLAVENDSQAKFLTTKQFHALKQMSDPLFRDVKYSVESLLFSLAVENDSQATDLYLKTTPKQHNKACHTADGLLCLENTSTHHPASPSKKPSSQSPPPNQPKKNYTRHQLLRYWQLQTSIPL